MSSSTSAPIRIWQSCGSPTASWFLVGLPLALILIDTAPALPSAMARLMSVLLVAALLWARGLGPVGTWPDRLFTGAWILGWAGALGAIATFTGWPGSTAENAGFLLTLLIGAAWLGGAVNERLERSLPKRLEAAVTEGLDFDPAGPPAITSAWAVSSMIFFALYRFGAAHWADSFSVGAALALFTLFQTVPPEVESES